MSANKKIFFPPLTLDVVSCVWFCLLGGFVHWFILISGWIWVLLLGGRFGWVLFWVRRPFLVSHLQSKVVLHLIKKKFPCLHSYGKLARIMYNQLQILPTISSNWSCVVINWTTDCYQAISWDGIFIHPQTKQVIKLRRELMLMLNIINHSIYKVYNHLNLSIQYPNYMK